MKNGSKIKICHLSLAEHNKINSEIEKFWLSKGPIIKKFHHPLFPLLFNKYSFVLKENDESVSYLYALRNSSKVFIHMIATRPQFYRKGYGSILLNHLIDISRKENIREIWCYILPENLASKAFFKSHGFIMRKEIKIDSDELRVLYKKTISHVKLPAKNKLPH